MKMKRKFYSAIFFFVILNISFTTSLTKQDFNVSKTVSSQNSQVDRKIVCYIGSWSVNKENFDIGRDFDPELCTHVILAFATIDGQGRIQASDEGKRTN